jgi:hypothetical protein
MSDPRGRKRFPLWKHKGSGNWCKKHKGRFAYFGRDKAAAKEEYDAKFKPDPEAWFAGQLAPAGALSVRDLCNQFLHAKRKRVDKGELTPGMWGEYFAAADRLVAVVGPSRTALNLTPDDFDRIRDRAADRLGPGSLGKFVGLVRAMYTWAVKNGKLPRLPVYGESFDKPARRVVRGERNRRGSKMVEAAECWKLIEGADVQLRAMVYLALNCGYGQTDCSNLAQTMLAVRPGWIDYPRPKTGTPRRCPLWEATSAALVAVEAERPDPADARDRDAVFLTNRGNRWVRYRDKGGEGRGVTLDSVAGAFAKLAKRCGVKASFYHLRHVHRTIADGAKDQPAADLIMGHTPAGMSSVYRERIGDERLVAVVEHVRAWLLAAG